MARDHAQVNVTIWTDPDFRRLPPAAQHLYFTLWTSPGLTYAGTHDWRPARLSGLAADWTREDITAASDCLRARHFLVTDEDREETLIRSWIRFDGLMKQPRMAVSCITAYAEIASSMLREVVAFELRRIHDQQPELTCWRDRRIAEVLDHPATSAKDLPVPADPFAPGFTHRFGPGFTPGLAQTDPKGYPSVKGSPTPAPAPAPP